MSDHEKFEAFKMSAVKENEEKSPAGEEGQEIARLRRKWLAYSM